jgi:hypothetical protein
MHVLSKVLVQLVSLSRSGFAAQPCMHGPLPMHPSGIWQHAFLHALPATKTEGLVRHDLYETPQASAQT